MLGPFLKASHPTQSKKPSASFTDEEVVALANFLRERVNDTMRGSPLFTVGDIVVGDAKAGEAYFNGEGGCATCHNATTRNLAGIATRIPAPVDLQQRMLFPACRRTRTRRPWRRGARLRPRPPVRGSERRHGDDRLPVGTVDIRCARGRERLLRHPPWTRTARSAWFAGRPA